MKINIPESISSRIEFKRKFSFAELYRALVFAPRAKLKLKENKKTGRVDRNFVERLQLAVTEVNGCAACSYQHTKMALRQGMSNEEISSFLSGGEGYVKPEEAKAILFAQHFADSRGYPKKYAYDSIVKEYGEQKARVILSAVQMMITGNMYGIPLSAFQSRLNGKPFKDSSLIYELGMLVSGIIVLPVAIIHASLRGFLGLPNERFDESAAEEDLDS